MVALSEITASNERLASTYPDGLVAVFVGGTSGVGKYTVKTLAKYVPNLRVYIVGRSQESADRILEECQKLSPHGKFEFIKADVSLLTGIDEVCRQIKSKETAINLLFESQGTMAFKKTTSEGLPLASGIAIHSRLRFILNLLPLLQNSKGLRRVVNVGGATKEGDIDLDNLPGKDLFLVKWRDQIASMSTLLYEETSRRAAPDVSFIHAFPGAVKGGIWRDAEGGSICVIIAISKLMEPFTLTPPVESGERHLFLATSDMYPARQTGAVAGVPLPKGKLAVAKGSDGQTGSGVYSVGKKGEVSPPKVEKVLADFRNNGTSDRVWEYVIADFKRITGTEVAL